MRLIDGTAHLRRIHNSKWFCFLRRFDFNWDWFGLNSFLWLILLLQFRKANIFLLGLIFKNIFLLGLLLPHQNTRDSRFLLE